MSSFDLGYNKQTDLLVFTHCIATGGGDLTRDLQKFFSSKNLLCGTDPTHEEFNTASKRYIARIHDLVERYNKKLKAKRPARFIYGHTPFMSDAESILDGRVHHITMLRDPVKRFVSHYRTEINEHNSLPEFKAWVKSVEAGNNSHHGHTWVEFNHQTAMLSGYQNNDVSERDLFAAKQNLKNFAFVGLTEEFSESAKLLFKILSMPFTYRPPLAKYKAKKIVPINNDVIRHIQEKSNFDIELYEFGKKLYHKKLQEFKDTPLLQSNAYDRYITHSIRDIDYWICKSIIKIQNKIFNDIANL